MVTVAGPCYDAPISRSRHSCPVQTCLNDSPGATLGAICNKSRLSPALSRAEAPEVEGGRSSAIKPCVPLNFLPVFIQLQTQSWRCEPASKAPLQLLVETGGL